MKPDKSLTRDEKAAIRALQRLANRWPKSLSLLSWSGSLCVVPTDERDEPHGKRNIAIFGIPNDGGDPDGRQGPDEYADWDDLQDEIVRINEGQPRSSRASHGRAGGDTPPQAWALVEPTAEDITASNAEFDAEEEARVRDRGYAPPSDPGFCDSGEE